MCISASLLRLVRGSVLVEVGGVTEFEEEETNGASKYCRRKN